jgi:hypothetical protein
MSGKYQIRKMRRDGVTQRYWMNPSREHDDAVTAVIGGDLALADSRKEQKLARQLLQNPSVQESVYRSLVQRYETTKLFDAQPMLFLRDYLSRGYPGAESLLVRLATEPSEWYIRAAAIYTIAKSMEPFVPRLIREVLDKAPNEDTARFAIAELAASLHVTMEHLIRKKITPAREAVLDALEMLGLALQGEWFEPKDEISSILAALDYKRFDFERAAQGQIPARVAEQVIDGLMSVLSSGDLTNEMFEQTLNVIKEWGSEYALSKLRSLWNGSLPHERRVKVINAINEIEHQLKRKSG